MKTLTIDSFSPTLGSPDTRESCKRMLGTIDCQDIMGTIAKISFSEGSKKIHIMMTNNNDLNATCMFARSLRDIHRYGNDPHFAFDYLTIPRFKKDREALYKIRKEMKRMGEIQR